VKGLVLPENQLVGIDYLGEVLAQVGVEARENVDFFHVDVEGDFLLVRQLLDVQQVPVADHLVLVVGERVEKGRSLREALVNHFELKLQRGEVHGRAVATVLQQLNQVFLFNDRRATFCNPN